MNWLSTDVPGMCKRKGSPALLVCLILVSVMPLISCRPEEEASGAALANDGSSRGVLLSHQKVHWLRPGEEKAPFDEHIPKERWTRLHSKKKQGSAKHSKTNGKHKKKIRNRNKSHKTNGEESATISSGLNYVTSEKKYFDYFPVEETQDKYHPLHDEDVNVVLLQLDPDRKKLITSENSVHNDKEPNKKRSKREIPFHTPEVRPEKGINNNEHVRRLRAAEQGNELSTVGQINNPARITRGIDYHRFSQPLNNFYLPAANPFYQPSGGFHKYAIPGKYYNPLSPPGTYSIGRPSSPEIGSRFGAEEDHVVWDIRYVSNQLPPGAAATSGTRPPAPPLIHNAATSPPASPPGQTPQRPSTTTPRPPSTTRARPQPRPTVRSEPSSCVWAILACCLPNDLNVRINCFEQRGCHGNFWDFNPCADSFQEAAFMETEQSINS